MSRSELRERDPIENLTVVVDNYTLMKQPRWEYQPTSMVEPGITAWFPAVHGFVEMGRMEFP